ncbi:ATP-binding protein [Trinickia sp.]|uniref:ATP-binding protein n=1 Tax=Trinickia sp. TaxID=2571163 RepID=UPI003F80B790
MTNNAIRRRLSLTLLAGVALVWVVTLASSFRHASNEVQRWQDARLIEFAELATLLDDEDLIRLARSPIDARIELPEHGEKAESAVDSDISPRDILIEVRDATGRLIAASPALAKLGPIPPRLGDAQGPWSATLAQTAWRVYAVDDARTGRDIRVMETSNSRSDLARGAAWHISRPLLIALPALALLVWLAIGRSLAPLRALSDTIRARDAKTLDPIDLDHVPLEVRPLVDAIDRLLAQLKHSIARERAFTADAAHELKTPLAAIKVQAQVALAAGDSAQRALAIQRVIQGVDRSAHVVEQLLLLARLDERERIPAVPVALDVLVQEAIARHAESARRQRIEIVFAPVAVPAVEAEPFLIGILLDNLFDNAIKYGTPGGRIEAALFDDGDTVRVAIRDNGPGVAESNRLRLTDRFYRGTDAGAPGSGLGLSIVARIASYFNGQLRFEPGIGGAGLGVVVSLQSVAEPARVVRDEPSLSAR